MQYLHVLLYAINFYLEWTVQCLPSKPSIDLDETVIRVKQDDINVIIICMCFFVSYLNEWDCSGVLKQSP